MRRSCAALPALKDAPLPDRLGAVGPPGAIVTRGGLIFVGGNDVALSAFDKVTGREVWRHVLPRQATATPMTYLAPDGRQMVVIATGRGEDTALVAFAASNAVGAPSRNASVDKESFMSDRYTKLVLTVIAAALLYLCVVLTPLPAVHAQNTLRPGEPTGPVQAVIVGWRGAPGETIPVSTAQPVPVVIRDTVQISAEPSRPSAAPAPPIASCWSVGKKARYAKR